MKGLLNKTLVASVFVLLMGACQEDFDLRYQLEDSYIEFEDAVTSTFAVGKDYPIISRVVEPSGDEVVLQVNMSGLQSSEDQRLTWKIIAEESTAAENVDFTIAGGDKSFVLPAHQNKGYIRLAPTSSGVGHSLLVLELVGTDKVKVSNNYKRVGVKCEYP
ncbi:hypothetical protein G5B30_15790 [Sphingobacterium sp. SGG-5]|uniref:hypothetical protein n=1 Tax=Sphingobacterium sp. SGG-5 TaxID=2710881 RepID=UPI0013EC2F8E|nr:hypothetical protein [Sphingobacterium sp. SGG-5]NGM63372.1 hypothetical protein [Sphingobacterium sp. SGG-5]